MKIRKKQHIHISLGDALIVVDLQNDFCPGGSLAVPDGDKIVSVVNSLMLSFSIVFATKDLHPMDHCSFKKFGGLWPVHCVEGTSGAEFHQDLAREHIKAVFVKGRDKNKDAYSGFEGARLGYATQTDPQLLDEFLHYFHASRIFVCGLATDYCVKATVLDGLKLGFEVYVVTDAIAAVNVNPNDGERALQEMVAAGAKPVKSRNIASNGDGEECNK